MANEVSCPLLVAIGLLRDSVVGAIDFDDKAILWTVEIDNIRPYGALTPEPNARYLSIAQLTPEKGFSLGLGTA